MAISNTEERYGSVAKTLHWLTALLVVTLIPLGWWANQMPEPTEAQVASKIWMFSLHKTLGVVTFFVAVTRVFWAVSQVKPGLIPTDRRAQAFVAETMHWTLYAALIIVPLSGWIGHAAAEGFAPLWAPLGQDLPLVPKDAGLAQLMTSVHWIATKVLIAALLLHIAGALKHHIFERDATLRRMLPGRAEVTSLPVQNRSRAPVGVAVVLWVVAIAVAVVFFKGNKADTDVAALPEIASDWIVQDGSIQISVTQFGKQIDGTFEQWTANIAFDETIAVGKVGHVTVTIAVPSLRLGTVTNQAKGADFLDAAGFGTAVFKADLHHAADGYQAIGTLTLKGKNLPLTLPFLLHLDADGAQMDGRVVLRRRDFGIGANMQDESVLGFLVPVRISLRAVRGG